MTGYDVGDRVGKIVPAMRTNPESGHVEGPEPETMVGSVVRGLNDLGTVDVLWDDGSESIEEASHLKPAPPNGTPAL